MFSYKDIVACNLFEIYIDILFPGFLVHDVVCRSAALRAVHDWNRRTPVSLATNQPVSESVIHHCSAESFFRRVLCHLGDGFPAGQIGEGTGIGCDSVFNIGIVHLFELQAFVLILDGDIAGNLVEQHVIGEMDLLVYLQSRNVGHEQALAVCWDRFCFICSIRVFPSWVPH